MLLVDAMYINSGGGKVLLDFLIDELENKKINVCYFLDSRLKEQVKYQSLTNVTFQKASLYKRHLFYRQHKNKFSRVLCFSNLPPTIRLDCEVYTFFQNVLLFEIGRNSFLNRLKGYVIKYFKKNSDFWIVQTDIVKNIILSKLGKHTDVLVLPFYNEGRVLVKTKKMNLKSLNFLYVSSGEIHKNHVKLFAAFCRFNFLFPNANLVVTIDEKFNKLIELIDFYKNKNVNIKNFGFKDSIDQMYDEADFCIYPSLAESFGLGLIEAAQAKLPIICSNLPYALEAVFPASTFNPNCENSIFSCLCDFKSYLNKPSIIKTNNSINKIINLLK
jgi:glycosyltransferase involved in cell wall biosynthesis